MAEISPDCSICNVTYDEALRKPRMLSCGHTYCQQCLLNVVSGSSPACPSCRKEIVCPVHAFPINFMLIPSSRGKADSGSVASTKVFCSRHESELDYWCSQCKVLICKECLVQTHTKHELILAEKIFANERILPNLNDQISANLLQVKTSIHTIEQVESLIGIIDELKGSIPMMKKSLLKQRSTFTDLLKVLEKISSEPSLEQKNLVLKMLKDQNQMQLEEDRVNKALKPFQDQVVQCQIHNLLNGKKIQLTDTVKYMPDSLPWIIISNELAEKALCTLKETGHQTPKATVISTDESPILCLPELLQYLASSCTTMELQLMDTAVKNPYKRDWLPLKVGGLESTDFNHCCRLKALANPLVYFQTLTAALAAFDYVTNESAENKVIILVYPATCTYDVCVLAFGKIVKSDTESWPLPLEVHVIGLTEREHFGWVKSILPSLYCIAQPDMGECRVYMPGYDYGVPTSQVFPVLTELGKKFSAPHRLYLPFDDDDDDDHEYYRREAKEHKIALEFKNF